MGTSSWQKQTIRFAWNEPGILGLENLPTTSCHDESPNSIVAVKNALLAYDLKGSIAPWADLELVVRLAWDICRRLPWHLHFDRHAEGLRLAWDAPYDLVKPATLVDRLSRRRFQRPGEKSQGVEEVAFAGAVGADQDCERAEADVTFAMLL
jgi:hypothetical protein